MSDHPNKPGNDDGAGSANDQAVKNQGQVKPEDYPKGDNGRPEDKDHNTA